MVDNSNLKRSILLLFIVYENVEGGCSSHYDGYNYYSYCTYYNPHLAILGASYGSVIGIGILLSLIVCCCCIQRENQHGYHDTVIVPTTQRTDIIPVNHQFGNQQNEYPAMAGVHGTQNSYIMMGPTHYGNSQGQISTHVGLPSPSSGTGGNLPGAVQSGT
ncbi:uncharacterized protein LOC133194898 [Saccostrea echinata]|uniref:uncharacterized protein LOC133194898 n=1 Tax=Saccostrea echinata TaxID=191078 RepID=UPI002A812170|nr:uncharacterized protein LOC133194898 [Saccostrea echinata]